MGEGREVRSPAYPKLCSVDFSVLQDRLCAPYWSMDQVVALIPPARPCGELRIRRAASVTFTVTFAGAVLLPSRDAAPSPARAKSYEVDEVEDPPIPLIQGNSSDRAAA